MTITVFRQLLQRFGLEYFNKYYGVYRATVEDNNDPEKKARLKLSIPQIYGNQVHNYWAYGKGMYAGDQIGFLALPNKGDGVYVSFENGDPRYPIWEYGWWAKGEMIESAKKNYPEVAVLQTTAGHRIEFDNKEGILRITGSSEAYVEITDKSISLVRKGKKLSLGSLNESSEAAVLGDKNQGIHDNHLKFTQDIVTEMIKMLSAFVPSNPQAIIAITTKLSTMLPLVVAEQKKTSLTKSKNVTIDA